MFTYLNNISEQIVNFFTIGMLNSSRSLYVSYISTHTIHNPNIVAYLIASFIVIIKLLVPVIFLILVLKNITNNVYVISIASITLLVTYSYIYMNPLQLFNSVSYGFQGFIEFIKYAKSASTQPFLFTFLNNMLIVFCMKILISFLGMWLFFALVLGFATFVIYIITAGKNPWEITNKKFKIFTLQLAIVFMIFYPLFGAIKAFITTFALLIGSIEIHDGIMTLRGYKKTCYNDNGRVVCKWAK